MLRSVVITSGSGLVLFEKEWSKESEHGAKWGGLIRALEEFAIQCVSMNVSYMEFPNVSVSVAVEPKTNLICTLFHDKADMKELGSLLASEIVNTFRETYRDKDFSASVIKNNMYSSFSYKLFDCICATLRSIVLNLQQEKGIYASLLVFDDGTEAIAEGELQDTLSVLANFQALQTIADQASNPISILPVELKREETSYMSLEMPKTHVTVHRIGQSASLVNICKKTIQKKLYMPKIENAVLLLTKVFQFMSLYHQ